MDALARVTGGLMTEATTPEQVTGVLSHTYPRTIRRAKTTLAHVVPYRVWIRQRPRTAEAIRMYRTILRELGATIAGHRPDVIKVIVGKPVRGSDNAA
jgi:hypothetical protein